MSVHNGEDHLRSAVDSILAQSFQDFEFIIVDDASVDKSFEILANYNDGRIRIVRNETNLGLAASLNRAIDQSKGTWIARQDADDISLPNRLAKQIKYLENHPDVGVIGTQMTIINEWGEPIGLYEVPIRHAEIAWSLLVGRSFAHPSVVIKADILRKSGGYDESYQVSQDHELWSRLLFSTRFYNLDEPLVRYRASKNTASYRRSIEQHSFRMRTGQALMGKLLEKEVHLKSVKWLSESQEKSCQLSNDQKRETADLALKLYDAFCRQGIFNNEDAKIAYPLVLDALLSIGQCGIQSRGQNPAGELITRVTWAATHPVKALGKLIKPLKKSRSDKKPNGQHDHSKVPGINSSVGLSIIVLTHNRPAAITSLFDNLSRQELGSLGLELLVFNNSDPSKVPTETSEFKRLLENVPNTKLLTSSYNWGTAARYALATLASHETILFLDDDLVLLDPYFIQDMFIQHSKLEKQDILSCWNELWVEWDESRLRTVSVDFLTPGINEIIPTDTIGPGIAMFQRHILMSPPVMDTVMQRNQEIPIVSDMGFSLVAAMQQGSRCYYYPAEGRLAFHLQAHKGAIYQIPKRHKDLLGLYKQLLKEGYQPLVERPNAFSKPEVERIQWAVETLPATEYEW